MGASVGDRITMHANSTGAADREGTIVAVLGSDGPPYRVRFDSGNESIVTPGPDATIAPPTVSERVDRVTEQAQEAATEAADRAREAAQDATGRAARKVSDAASKIAERFQR